MLLRWGFVTAAGIVSLVGVSGSAAGFRHSRSSQGVAIHWDRPVQIDLDLRERPATVGQGDSVGAIRNSFSHWQPYLPPQLTVGFMPPEERPLPANGRDHLNVIRWSYSSDEVEALATTYLTYNSGTGTITDADIVINAGHPWTARSQEQDPCDDAYDLENVVTHEVGHLMGMAHSQLEEATMFATAPLCETDKRDLSDDDIEGVGALYLDVDVSPPEIVGYGCASGSHGSIGTLLFVLFALALGWLRTTRWGLVGLVALSGFISTTASATLVQQRTVEDLARSSELVVRGRVISQQSFWLADRIYTESVVVISECWAGNCGETVAIRQIGGEVDGVGMLVEGVAALSVGDTFVGFLERRDDGAYRPLGMAQGVFHVRPDRTHVGRDLRTVILVTGTGAAVRGAVLVWSLAELRSVVAHARRSSGRSSMKVQ